MLSARHARPDGARQGPRDPEARALLLRGEPPHLRGVRRARAARARRSTSSRSAAWLQGPRAPRAGRRHGATSTRDPRRGAGRRATSARTARIDPREVPRPAAHRRRASASPPQGYGDFGERAGVHRRRRAGHLRASRARRVEAERREAPRRHEEVVRAAQRRRRSAAIASPASRPASSATTAKTAGLHDGDLTIVAARPGMGKTQLRPQHRGERRAARKGRELGERSEPALGRARRRRRRLLARNAARAAREPHGLLRGRASTSARCARASSSPQDWSKLTQAASFLGSLPDLDRRHARRSASSSSARRCGASRPSTTARRRTGRKTRKHRPASSSTTSSS